MCVSALCYQKCTLNPKEFPAILISLGRWAVVFHSLLLKLFNNHLPYITFIIFLFFFQNIMGVLRSSDLFVFSSRVKNCCSEKRVLLLLNHKPSFLSFMKIATGTTGTTFPCLNWASSRKFLIIGIFGDEFSWDSSILFFCCISMEFT